MSQHLQDADEKSELILGGINHNRYHGSINWHPVVDQRFWTVELEDIEYDGKSTNYCKSAKPRCRAAIDSGSTSFGVPAPYKKIIEKF